MTEAFSIYFHWLKINLLYCCYGRCLNDFGLRTSTPKIFLLQRVVSDVTNLTKIVPALLTESTGTEWRHLRAKIKKEQWCQLGSPRLSFSSRSYLLSSAFYWVSCLLAAAAFHQTQKKRNPLSTIKEENLMEVAFSYVLRKKHFHFGHTVSGKFVEWRRSLQLSY